MKKRKPIVKMSRRLAEQIKRFAERAGMSLAQATEHVLSRGTGTLNYDVLLVKHHGGKPILPGTCILLDANVILFFGAGISLRRS